MKSSVAVISLGFVGLAGFMAALGFARHEYAKELLTTSEATALWRESDSISGALVSSTVIDKIESGDNNAALRILCQSLRQDVRNLEGLADISQLNDQRVKTLKQARDVFEHRCQIPHA